MSTEGPASTPTPAEVRPRRRNRRLRILIVVAAVSGALYGFAQMDRGTAEALGPVGEAVYDILKPSFRAKPSVSAEGQQFLADMKALGGMGDVWIVKPGWLGSLGREERYRVRFQGRVIGDQALARIAERHGSRIGSLYLQLTSVTDAGLAHLKTMRTLQTLDLRAFQGRRDPQGPPPGPGITDAGLVHLEGLDRLGTLFLDDLPITDRGLASLQNLPNLQGLYLSGTNVRGPGLATLKSLPRLAILYLDHTELTDDGLKALSGATNLHFLSLKGVHLTETAIPLLKAIPALEQLDITGCGFLDEEVADLVKARPKLKVIRK
jgi:hypothetical protein